MYNIGDWVMVRGVVKAEEIVDIASTGGRRKNRRLHSDPGKGPFLAQICGEGRREEGSVSYMGYEEESGTFDCKVWCSEKSHLVWLVRRGMLNKEIAVFPNDLKPAEAPEGGLPRLFMDRPMKPSPKRKRYIGVEVSSIGD